MKIRKRNGDLVDFEVDKIQTAIKKAFNDTNTEITEEIKKIGKYIKRKIEKDDSLANVESIQDLVEVELQKRGYYQEAKEYILYRDKRNKHRTLMAKFDKIVNDKKILAIIDEIPKEFEEERYPLESFYQKVEAFTGKTNITEKEILDSLIKASSELTDKNSPDWEFIAARFLMYKLDKEIDRNEEKYGIVDFKTKIKFLEKDGRYGSYILENYSSEEIDELEDYINKDYDKLLTYSGLDLLIKRYIIKTKEDEPLERVQEMFMGIAMHLAMNEENKIGFAKDVYDILASLKATMATPTMSNARKPHHQLSSCFIDTVDDSLEGIFDSVSRFAKVSKFGGGMGMYMGKVRANGSDIRGYKGAAGGVIRWIRIINDTAVAVDQLGCVAKNSYVKVLESVKTNNFTHRYLKRAEKYNKDIDKKYIELVTNEAKNHAFKYGTFSKSTIENLLSDYVNGASPNSSINKYSLSNQQYKKIIGKFKKIDKPVIDGFVRIKTNPDYAINESGDILNLKSYKFLNSYRINKKGYIEATIGKKKYPLHSLLYETFIGSRNGFTIDHIDKNKLNNQLSNLQLLSNEENISKGWNTKSEIDKRSESIKVKAHLSYNKALNGKRRNSIPTEILEIKEKIVPISDVQTGDLIKSLNPNTGKVVYKEVEALHDITVKHKDQIKIKYENGSYIVTSLWHPTYNKKPNEEKFEFIRADQVEVGDVGLSENLEENKVVEVDFNPQYDEDYKDLTIKDTNCYFVSTDDEFNDMFLIHNTRQGSVACYLDLWHKDMPEFLGLRTNNGDDRMKAHDVFPAICVPDLFWRLCRDDINATWYMFDPHEVEQKYGKALEDTYGEEWEEFYNTLVADKNISKRTIQVKELVRLIIKSWAETGTPFVFNRDTVNKMNPNKHAGMIYSSNLCSEICQNMTPAKPINEKIVTTEDGDTVIVKTDTPGDFVECNLASLTLGNLDVNNKEELEHTINTIVRALDNVIDLNYYPTPYAEVTNKRYRAIGLGTSGYHHMLVKNGIRWSDKEEHLEFVDRVYEDINYYTIKASMIIAKEKGPYELFEGSDWQTGDYFDLRNYNSDRWEELRKDVKKYGIRNSYLMAIAPTGSTSIISGTSAGVDPIMSRYYLEEKKGSIVPRVAPGLDNRTFWLYENAHNVDQNITVEATGIRQRHIDQSQSVNIYITTDYTMRQILNIYINAWENGVKSLYYVRGKSLEIEDCEVCSA